MDVSSINFENPGFWVCVIVGVGVAIWSTVKQAADYWHSAARGALAVQQRQNAEMQVRLISAEGRYCATRDALAVARQREGAVYTRLLELESRVAIAHREQRLWREHHLGVGSDPLESEQELADLQGGIVKAMQDETPPTAE